MAKNTKEIAPAKTNIKIISEALSAPFDPQEVRFKPAVVSGNRALALAYVDARAIQDRLDSVLGVEGWQDTYKCLEDGSVVCRLRLLIGDTWISKVDVGSPSEQGDAGDRRKAAFSDALKRAAVKFGIGRYLYRFPSQWVDYDPYKKQFVQTPKLPPFAIPKKESAKEKELVKEPEFLKANTTDLKKANVSNVPANLPANGLELQRRLYDYDAKLAKQGLITQGSLVKHVVEAGVKAGLEADLSAWSGNAMLLAAEATKTYETQARSSQKKRKEVA